MKTLEILVCVCERERKEGGKKGDVKNMTTHV